MSCMHKYIFLDRDGTLVKDTGYLADGSQVELLTEAVAALRQLAKQGWRFAIITNQSGVARGILTRSQVETVNNHVVNMLALQSVNIDATYYCPHRPESQCSCRKPQPGLVERAVIDLQADPRSSVMVGDRCLDAQAGVRAGIRGVVIGIERCQHPGVQRVANWREFVQETQRGERHV